MACVIAQDCLHAQRHLQANLAASQLGRRALEERVQLPTGLLQDLLQARMPLCLRQHSAQRRNVTA